VALSLALILALGLAGSAAAVEIRGGDEVTIGKDEVIDDDLILGGSRVVVDGTVNGSLVAGGQSVTLNGRVNGSMYASGASVTLGPEASVGRNLFFAGYSLTAEGGSAITRDALVTGYQGILGGEVGRDVRANVAEPDPAFPRIAFMPGMPSMIEPGLRVGPEAVIGGQLTYSSAVEQANAIEAQPEGGVVYQTPEPGARPEARPSPRVSFAFNVFNWFIARGREFITLLVFGALMLWKGPALLSMVTEKARTQALPAAGWGWSSSSRATSARLSSAC